MLQCTFHASQGQVLYGESGKTTEASFYAYVGSRHKERKGESAGLNKLLVGTARQISPSSLVLAVESTGVAFEARWYVTAATDKRVTSTMPFQVVTGETAACLGQPKPRSGKQVDASTRLDASTDLRRVEEGSWYTSVGCDSGQIRVHRNGTADVGRLLLIFARTLCCWDVVAALRIFPVS
jgi:hypothetical protein